MAGIDDTAPTVTAAPVRPLRVLTVLAYYHPHWTGLTMFARRIAEGLVASGAEVTVICSRHDDDLPEREVIGGVAVERVSSLGRLSRTPVMPGFPAALVRLVRRHDLVHLHSPMAEAGVVAAACRAARVPLVVTHQGDVVMPEGFANQVIERTMRTVLGATFRQADRVVTHNDDYLRHSLTSVAGDRASAIEPPVAMTAPTGAEVRRFREAHGLGDRPVVAFAGRWVEEKGFDVLLHAAPTVLGRCPDAVFVFAGERNVAYEDFTGRCAPLTDALGDRFVDVGLLLDSQRLAAFYGAATVFVLPSRTDCHAAVQVEALLCGTPLVVSDIAGARHVVATTDAGLLVPAEDPGALAEAIVSVLAAPDRFEAAVVAAAQRFDPAQAVDRYRRLLDDVVADPRHRSRRTPPPDGSSIDAPEDSSVGPGSSAVAEGLLAGELDLAYRRRVRWLLARLPVGPGRVLDAGTGLGNVLHVAERVRPDLSFVGGDQATDRLGRAAADGVRAPLVRADLVALPHPDASFDAVLCSEVLEHLDDDAAGLDELARVLRPGGRLLVSVPHADYPWTWDPIARGLEACHLPPIRSGPLVGIWTGHVRLYRPADLVQRLEGAGLVVDEVESQTHHALPFSHLALYGVGRGLVERRLLPDRSLDSVSRYRDVGDPPPPRGGAIALVRRVLERVDRRNEDPTGGERSFVSLVAVAHRPGPEG